MVTLCELFVVALFLRFFRYFSVKKLSAMRKAGQVVTCSTRTFLAWIGFMAVTYLCQLSLRVFYRPYLVYCSHFNDQGALYEYLRDFA